MKYWICKAAPAFIYEAMECIGGNAYVEDSLLPRLYREAPVNAIWEGSGNVMALDLLRAASREEGRAVVAALARETDGLPGASDAARCIERALTAADGQEARAAIERLALLAATAALAKSVPEIAETFAQTRFCEGQRNNYGAVDLENAGPALLGRALPA